MSDCQEQMDFFNDHVNAVIEEVVLIRLQHRYHYVKRLSHPDKNCGIWSI